jgi:hypothetical protein
MCLLSLWLGVVQVRRVLGSRGCRGLSTSQQVTICSQTGIQKHGLALLTF